MTDTRPEDRYRVRLRPGRHPYGHQLWAWEVYDPAGQPNMQVVISGCWFPSWDQARREGLKRLGYYQYRQRFVTGMPT